MCVSFASPLACEDVCDRRLRLRVEQRVAGEHVVDEQQAQEVAPHRLGLAFEAQRRWLAADLPQRARQGRQRLVVQGHGPGAAHVVAHRRVGRLQRVVPVAVAVRRQRGAGDRAPARHGERAQHVLPDRAALAGPAAALRVERDRLVEDRRVAARDQVLAEREQRPEHDVAVRVAGADRGVALEEHEPLRPVAVGALRLHHAQQQVAHRRGVAVREQQLGRALADVARAPAAARELLEPARREVVDQRVLAQPGQQLDEAAQAGVGGAVGRHGDRQVLGGEAFRRRGGRIRIRNVGPLGDEATEDREAKRTRGRGLQQQVRQLAAHAVGEQALVAGHLLDDRLVARRLDAPVAFREALRELALRARREHDRAAVALRRHPTRRAAVVAVQRDVQADETAQRRPLDDLDVEAHRVRIAARLAAHLDAASRMAVDPAAAVGPHLERRRLVQQAPGAIDLDEEAQPVRTEQPEVAAHGRQAAVDADVPLRQHRMEHAAHPCRRRQGAFVGNTMGAGAQQVAVRPQHRELLRAQHDVVVPAVEEAEHAAFGVALDMAPFAVEPRIEVG